MTLRLVTENDPADDELTQMFDRLGTLLATPGINPDAERRREELIRLCRQEIVRLQRLQAERWADERREA